ncbi:glycosyltransferase family 2 protein [Thiomicrospira sp. S5]|uniref:glycosyltransferase family 2 protein n=1 Tax=Thiomicrospira sp. S5 TaxID=1803865 RepID=UPI000F89F01F|nr:glycosyltransferase family 2 protein [Thiomicrospira sp. S5]AZR81693.1 hypothetical protein AYJ59_04985 [Thiomicrospira sp. S5]
MMSKVYFIILNYNGWRDTQECLESALKLDYPNFQVIVVDNNSPNDSMSHLLAWAKGEELATGNSPDFAHLSTPPIKKPIEFVLYDKPTALAGGNATQEVHLNNPIIFIQSDENRGFAAGNNIGTEYALKKGDAEYLWYLNNDTVVEPNALSEYVKKANQYKENGQRVGIIGAKLMYYHQPKLIQAIGGIYNKWLATTKHIGAFEEDIGQYDNEDIVKKISYPVGASMLVDIAFIKDVGMMCEDYFLYFEELDWVCRGKEKGWQIGYCWCIKIFHKEGGSIGSSSDGIQRSELSDYYGLINRIAFTRKFFPNMALIVRLSFLVVLFNRIKRRQFDRALQTIKFMLRRYE